jgi:hypothetical protein
VNDPLCGWTQDQGCSAKGGSFWDHASYLLCDAVAPNFKRSYFNKNIGVRCCANALP